MAEESLAAAEAVDLGAASSAALVATVESLRSSLFDMIQLARRLSQEPPT